MRYSESEGVFGGFSGNLGGFLGSFRGSQVRYLEGLRCVTRGLKKVSGDFRRNFSKA